MWETMFTLILLSLAVSAASMTFAKANVFAWFRAWVGKHSEFFGELVNCPYCTSHWFAAAGALVFQPLAYNGVFPLWTFLLTMFVTVALAAFWSGVIYDQISKIPH
jgi:hypothetical protein